ncbi:hypothetical protein NKK48_01630 [Mesorhizobium sp. C386A]|uniref:hypothetical protein n=1 Tax=unclassified Mesorhizobium TaxID=325217 RepID=UPI0003CEEACA|nr:hypothetical protein [Mesorhizobium sp. LNJC386A00]ESY35780.1 hypothetical protein X748_14315 [Mesorhizobium sp. LNJC386A00]
MLLSKNLAPLRAAALEKIDNSAGEVRKRFITSAPGQEMVYQQKRVEAELLMAQLDVAPAEIPHIVAEASLNGITPYDQAVVVLTMSQQWMVISAQIEETRLAAKQAVAAAMNPAAIELASTIDWSAYHA